VIFVHSVHSVIFVHPVHSVIFLHPVHPVIFLHPVHSVIFLHPVHSVIFVLSAHPAIFVRSARGGISWLPGLVRPGRHPGQRLSSRCLHDTHRVARGNACRRAFPIGCPQDSQTP